MTPRPAVEDDESKLGEESAMATARELMSPGGMLTDRDIVVKCIAEGKDPNEVTAAELAQGKPVTIDADDSG